MSRKLLFICFSDDSCRLTHALWWANEVAQAGHTVQVLFEGLGTRALTWLDTPEAGPFTQAFREAQRRGVIAGACSAAAAGCAGEEGCRKPSECAAAENVPLRQELGGHAGIAAFVNQGFELVVF
jgi:hypothetical protein